MQLQLDQAVAKRVLNFFAYYDRVYNYQGYESVEQVMFKENFLPVGSPLLAEKWIAELGTLRAVGLVQVVDKHDHNEFITSLYPLAVLHRLGMILGSFLLRKSEHYQVKWGQFLTEDDRGVILRELQRYLDGIKADGLSLFDECCEFWEC